MARLAGVLFWIAIALVAACATEAPIGATVAPTTSTALPSVTTPAVPSPMPSGTTVPAPASATPTALGGVAPPPTTTFAPATPSPTAIAMMMRDLVNSRNELRDIARDEPTPNDLVAMVRRTTALTAEVGRAIPQLTLTERQQALREVGRIMVGMLDVVDTFIAKSEGIGPTAAMGTPHVISGTPVAVVFPPARAAGSASPPPTVAEDLTSRVDEIRSRIADLTGGKPQGDDINGLLMGMISVVTAIRQEASLLSTEDLERLTSDLAAAMNELVPVMEAYVAPRP